MITRTLFLTSLDTGTVSLGYSGDNEHVQILIKCDSVYDVHPDAAVSMLVQTSSGTIYEKEVTKEDNNVTWIVTDTDTAQAGNGRFQLTFTDGTEIMKSDIAQTTVLPSILL